MMPRAKSEKERERNLYVYESSKFCKGASRNGESKRMKANLYSHTLLFSQSTILFVTFQVYLLVAPCISPIFFRLVHTT